MAYMKYIILLLSVICITDAVVTCGTNEYVERCGRPFSCQPTCAEPNRTVACSMFICARGCECNKGYVRMTEQDEDNPCIKIDQCPGQIINK
ncbi:unnamed protein product [Adineta steineri]|uniref:TIL domain-containing protein n=2 Tax=Adineta steineri TaxID=433720 RepID=A0A813Z7B1_9BILA|nr:unnamed protein product [Adineta steineri]